MFEKKKKTLVCPTSVNVLQDTMSDFGRSSDRTAKAVFIKWS